MATENDLVLTRTLNAHRELVWKAWTEPVRLAQWWGPQGFTNPVCQADVRPGGAIYIEMKAPDGVIHPMSGIFVEVKKPERLVFKTQALDDRKKALFEIENTITFAEEGGATKLTLKALILYTTEAGKPYLSGMEEGWNMTLDRLDGNLGKMNAGTFVIERLFNAPVEKVWKAITDKNEMKKWYFDLAEFRPETGFEFQFKGGPDDRSYLHLCKITEVIPGKKLRHTWKYQGYDGLSHVTFELFPENNKTRLRLTHEGLDTFPPNEPDLARGNFAKGWTQLIDISLGNYLQKNA